MTVPRQSSTTTEAAGPPRFWPFVAHVWSIARWHVIVGGGLAVAVGVTSGASALLLVPLVRAAGLDPGTTGRAINQWFDWALALVGLTPSLGAALAALVLVTVFQSLLMRTERGADVAIELDVNHYWRTRLFAHLCGTDWTSFSRYRSSDLFETLIEQVDRVGTASRMLVKFASSAAVAAAYALVALRLSPSVTAIALAAGLLFVAVLARLRQKSSELGEAQGRTYKELYAVVSESLQSMKTIRAYNGETAHIDAVRRASGAVTRLYRDSLRAEAAAQQVFEVGSVVLLAVIAYAALAWSRMPPAELFVLLFVFARVTPHLTGLHTLYQRLQRELPAFALVSRLDRETLASVERVAVDATPVPFARDVRLDGVNWAYTAEAPVLRDVSLRVGRGETVAIVGASGSGKTTIADVLLGLLPPQSGRLLVDGTPIGPERASAWRAHLGYVPQESLLFHDTLRANLRWAAPRASDEDLRAALEAAAAWRFVSAAPRGLDTIVGDRGTLVSGGERQRLALARALLRQPQLLILDEATSALDSENERLIETAIERLHGRLSIVLIAHRLSTVPARRSHLRPRRRRRRRIRIVG